MHQPIVNAPCGVIAGIHRPDSLAFLGIPYAEPPVAALRFAKPVRRANFDGVFDATAFGATPQRRYAFPGETTIPEPIILGDDMLNLNVFTPSLDAQLPVHVYIHGGGFIAGSHIGSWFDGAPYNRDGIVVVAISYRLGFHGFGWIQDAPSNRGMLDMVCALEWVRDNIAAFGGDPNCVTISGQSAGGGSVLALLAMPSAEGLFHRVIAQSAVIGAPTAAVHEAAGRAFAELAQVSPTVDGWSELTEAQVLELQFGQMHADPGIHPMSGRLLTEPGALCDVTMDWGPAVDPASLPVPPFEAWSAGLNNRVPVLLGATADEFMMPALAPAPEVVREWLQTVPFDDRLRAHAIDQLSNGSDDPIGRIATTVMFRRNVLRIAAARRAGGASVWTYDFRHISSVSGVSGHCIELPFTWNCLSDPHAIKMIGADMPQEVADAMHGAWVKFMREGDPGWVEGTGRVFGGSDPEYVPFADVSALA